MTKVAMQMKDGEVTSTIYGMIRDQKYNDCTELLQDIIHTHESSRAAYSLLGYCYYQNQDFVNAADCYEKLIGLNPEIEDYKLYYAQSLYKACLYEEAMKVSSQFDNPEYALRISKLQAAIKYGEEDYVGAQNLIDQTTEVDADTSINQGCLLYNEDEYDKACQKFMSALNVVGFRPSLAYNIALCYYQQRQFAPALKHIADVIERGIRTHPELSVGMTTEGIDVRSVGNTLVLHETALVEAFNLKSAIEYQLKNFDAAREALTDMPPRTDEELDAITLHNQALMNMDSGKATKGFEKLQFLIQQNPFPEATFGNLLLLYVKYEYYDLAADVLAENAHLTYKYLSTYLYSFLEAAISRQSSPEEAYRKLDEIANSQTDILRKLTKQIENHNALKQTSKDPRQAKQQQLAGADYITAGVPYHEDDRDRDYNGPMDNSFTSTASSSSSSASNSPRVGGGGAGIVSREYTPNSQVQEARTAHDDDGVKKAVNEYDEVLERYIPVLMQQAKIFWDRENYQQVERIFRKSVEFCNEHEAWKLNVAHVLFMQDNKFKEATGFYEPIVKKHYDNILGISAIVLANLCVAYIMTSQNEEAEELMRKIEKEEERIAYDDPEKKIYHLCIVNLVIGTLYCAKGNYEFGISRVIKSLEPYQKKLGTDTWYHAKRCFLSLIENMTKHMVMLRDNVLAECIQFLEHCEVYGQNVLAREEPPLAAEKLHPGRNTVTFEARHLKSLLIQLMDYQ